MRVSHVAVIKRIRQEDGKNLAVSNETMSMMTGVLSRANLVMIRIRPMALFKVEVLLLEEYMLFGRRQDLAAN
jgi:hypothetical protein